MVTSNRLLVGSNAGVQLLAFSQALSTLAFHDTETPTAEDNAMVSSNTVRPNPPTLFVSPREIVFITEQCENDRTETDISLENSFASGTAEELQCFEEKRP